LAQSHVLHTRTHAHTYIPMYSHAHIATLTATHIDSTPPNANMQIYITVKPRQEDIHAAV